MRVLLDESLPRGLKGLSDHDAATVPEAGWVGSQNVMSSTASPQLERFPLRPKNRGHILDQRAVALAIALVVLLPQSLGAQLLELVANTGAFRPASLRPSYNPLVSFNQRDLFFAAGRNDESDLWFSDGTASGTRMVLAGCAGAIDCGASRLLARFEDRAIIAFGPINYGVAHDSEAPLFLWEGFAPGARLRDHYVGAISGGDHPLLVRSDGTPSGTSVEPLSRFHELRNVQHFDDHRALAEAESHATGYEVLLTDGTAAGTVSLAVPAGISSLLDGSVYFVDGEILLTVDRSGEQELWRLDPAGGPPSLLRSFSFGAEARKHGDWLFIFVPNTEEFWAYGGSQFREVDRGGFPLGAIGEMLLRQRRVGAGQRIFVTDLASGVDLPIPDAFLQVFNAVAFRLSDQLLLVTGQDLWAIRESGEVHHLSGEWPSSNRWSIVDDVLYANGTSAGLFRSDGTLAGTYPVAVRGLHGVAGISAVTPARDGLYFVGQADSDDSAIWFRTPGGSFERLAVLPRLDGNTRAREFSAFGLDSIVFKGFGLDTLYFASGGQQARELDPQAIGCAEVSQVVEVVGPREFALVSCENGRRAVWPDLRAHPVDLDGSRFRRAVASSDGVFLHMLDTSSATSDHSLWFTDGTPSGTHRILQTTGEVRGVRALGAEVFFFLRPEAEFRWQVWRSDGTPAGTERLDGALGAELWLEAVARRSPFFESFVQLGDDVYFRAIGDRASLWRIDSGAGTAIAVAGFEPNLEGPLVAVGERLLLEGKLSPGGVNWIRSFDPQTGASEVLLESSSSREFVAVSVGEEALFGRACCGGEVFVTDGTSQGTREFDVRVPRELEFARVSPSTVIFPASANGSGVELYRYDLGSGEPQLVQDLNPGSLSSNPQSFTGAAERTFFVADDGVFGAEVFSFDHSAPRERCQPGPSRLCLQDQRLQVELAYRIDHSVRPAESREISDETGAFWFFEQANLEILVKLLDGRGINGAFWTFFGAMSNLEYQVTVTDAETLRVRRYVNLPGGFTSLGDTRALPDTSAPEEGESIATSSYALGEVPAKQIRYESSPPEGNCTSSTGSDLCLGDGRFSAAISWTTFDGSTGHGVPVDLEADTGCFWFFEDTNIEAFVKVLDGRAINNKFWVYFGSLTNVAFQLAVTDRLTGTTVTYDNPLGHFASFGDVSAFAP